MKFIKSAICLSLLVALLAVVKTKYYCPTKNDHFSEHTKLQKIKGGDIPGITAALELFLMETGRYPTTAEGLELLVSNSIDAKDNWELVKLPIDPWGNTFVYVRSEQHGQDFLLYSKGPDGVDDNGAHDDIVNWEKAYDCSLY